MPTSKSARPIPVAARVNRFSYAIRNIVAEAQAVEARGMRVRYLNIGDPVAFGFQTPAHLVEAADAGHARRPQRLPAVGRHSRRRARRWPTTTPRAGVPVSPDRVLITTGTSEGDRPGAQRARRRRRRGAGAVADLSALHRGAGEDRTRSRGTTAPTRIATGCPTSITCAAWSRRARACWS